MKKRPASEGRSCDGRLILAQRAWVPATAHGEGAKRLTIIGSPSTHATTFTKNDQLIQKLFAGPRLFIRRLPNAALQAARERAASRAFPHTNPSGLNAASCPMRFRFSRLSP